MNELIELAAKIGCTVEQLETALAETHNLPKMERDRYRAMGWGIIEPGSPSGVYHGMSKREWLPSSFLAKSSNEIQISLIAAKHQGRGSFSRLLMRLDKLGLRVRIVSPLPQMEAILVRKGFVAEHTGSTFEDRKEIWERKCLAWK